MTPQERNVMEQALEGGGLYEITGRIEDIDKCIVHRSVIKEALMSHSDGAQPAVPQGHEQEPVAWLWVVDGKPHNVTFGGANSNTPKDWTVFPLYTSTPPQQSTIVRKPLTDKVTTSMKQAGLAACVDTELDPTWEELEIIYKAMNKAAHGITEE